MQIMEQKISVKCGAAQHLIKKKWKKTQKPNAVNSHGIRLHLKKEILEES